MIVMLRSLSQSVGIALLAVFSAFGLMLALDLWLDITTTPYLLFFGALTFSAWYGGSAAGIICTFLSAVLANIFLIQPTNWLDPNITLKAAVFVTQGIVISLLGGKLKTSQRKTRNSLQQLQANQRNIRRLIDANLIGVMTCNHQGVITAANPEFLRMTGFTQEDIQANRVRWDELTPFDLKPLDAVALRELHDNGRNTPYEKALIGKDGHRIPTVVGAALLEDDPDTMIGFVLDVTQLKRAETRLSVQFAITRVLAETATLKEAVPAILQALCESLGWQLGAIWRVEPSTGQIRCIESWHAPHLDMQEFETSIFQQTFAPGVGLPGQVWATGKPMWVTDLSSATQFPRAEVAARVGLRAVMGFPILLDQEVLGVIECFSIQSQSPHDDLLQLMTAIGSQIGQYIERKRAEETYITERRQAEEELRRSEQLYRAIGETIDYGIWMCKPDGHSIYVSQAFLDLVGLTHEQFAQQGWGDVLHPEDAERTIAAWESCVQAGAMWDIERRFRGVDGRWYSILSRGIPIRDEQGTILYWAGINLDITGLKQVEAELRSSEERFRLAAHAVAGMVYDWDVKTGYVFRSEGLYRLVGIYPDETNQSAHWWGERMHPDDAATVEALWPALVDGRQDFYKLEYRVRHEDGHWVDVWDQGYIMRDETGQMCRVVGSTADISDRKRAEAERERLLARERAFREEAEQANRMKNEFLAVLSHELRSPLNPILGWTHLLRSRQFDAATTDRALESIERNARLQVQLIEDLLDVSRILQGNLRLKVAPVHLAEIVEAAIETIQLAAQAKSITIHTELEPQVPPIMGDGDRLQQIIWNLLSNAVKFTPAGGRIDIHLSKITAEADVASIPHGLTSYIQIQIRDTGRGIRPEFLPHVFEYFRQDDSTITRKFGGLGLGLAIVRHLIELHGGTVQADSPGDNQGATFTLCLPHMEEPSQSTTA